MSGEGFSGAREILIEAGADKSYTLTFSPAWICESKGQLVLINTVTSERYVYRLTGVAEEPLAEGHLKLECQARQRTSVRSCHAPGSLPPPPPPPPAPACLL